MVSIERLRISETNFSYVIIVNATSFFPPNGYDLLKIILQNQLNTSNFESLFPVNLVSFSLLFFFKRFIRFYQSHFFVLGAMWSFVFFFSNKLELCFRTILDHFHWFFFFSSNLWEQWHHHRSTFLFSTFCWDVIWRKWRIIMRVLSLHRLVTHRQRFFSKQELIH